LADGVRSLARTLSWGAVGRYHREIYYSLLDEARSRPEGG
jgi:hypothetical protein